MIEKKWLEKRQDVRSAFSVPVKAKIAEFKNSDKIKSLTSSVSTSHHTDAQASDIVPLLIEIDEKLNKLIGLMDSKDSEGVINVIKTINISGSGMSLVLAGHIEKGQRVDFSLRLPGFPLGKFEVCGEVIRVSPNKETNQGHLDVGIKFLNISQDDRDRLISYIFKQQRKNIRQSGNS